MITTKRANGLAILFAALTVIAFSLPAQAIEPEKPCANCGHHDGKDGALMPKEAPVVSDPSPDPRPAPDRLRGGADGAMLRTGTDSTMLRTGTDSTMLRTGTDSTMLRTGTDSTMLRTGTDSTMIHAGVERKALPLNIEILIDCSQSMKEGLGGALSGEHEEKMNAAKRVLEQTMATIPPDVNIGLRVFGQSFHNDPYIDCQQSALLVPIGNHNRRAIVERIRQVRPFGLTPLTFALHEAANDLSQTDGLKQIILISDGAETCGQDPCAMVRAITASGINMKIDIVGLGLKHDWEARNQLNCISSSSGGKFYDANTAADLIDSIRRSVKEAVGESKVSGKVLTKMKPSLDDLPADMK